MNRPLDDPFALPDPALSAPYPVGLSLDLALETADLDTILASYELTKEQFVKILKNPAFKKELEDNKEAMKQEGWSFRKKAAMQAEMYLHKIYAMVHADTTPANVKADLIKATTRWAGYDTPPVTQSNQGPDLSKLAEQMKTLTDGELELRVAQLVFRRTSTHANPVDTPPTNTLTPLGVTYDSDAA